MSSYQEKITNLVDMVSTCCNSGDFSTLIDTIRTESEASLEIWVDMEIVFRRIAIQFGARNLSHEIDNNKQKITLLLKAAIEVGIACADISSNFPKMPFLIIEDLLEAQTLSNAAIVWELVESMVDTLTKPELFNRGKLVILRTCNSLLRRLSKSCHTEFCGRVLMFLAAVYPLSERSAVNLMGKVNTGNCTAYEDKEEFLSAVTSDVAPLVETEEKREEDEVHGEEEDGEVSDSGAMDVTVVGQMNNLSSAIEYDYSLYRTFWDIQKFLSSDPKSTSSKSSWCEMMSAADSILSVFESNKYSPSELKQAQIRREKVKQTALQCSTQISSLSTASGRNQHVYMGCKYLTSSQLFALELKDPSIRLQVATQLLIVLHHRLRSPVNQSSSAISTTKLPQKVEPTEEDLIALEKRIYAIVETTPPNGQELAATLRTVLGDMREERWMQWKVNHCPSYEKPQLPIHTESEYSGHKKRKLSASTKDASYFFDHHLEQMQTYAKKLADKVPSLVTFVEDYIEAEDPDAGIEDEYHPKHDTVYCWRTRRLIACNKLSVFEHMNDGSIAKSLGMLFPDKVKSGSQDTKSEKSKSDNVENDTDSGNTDEKVTEKAVVVTSQEEDAPQEIAATS